MTNLAMVTGASSGIGLATSISLTSLGYTVVGLARDFTRTTTLKFNALEIDLADLDALPELLKSNPQLAEAPKLLVLNASYGRFGGLEQFSHTQIRHLIDTNLSMGELF